MRQNYKSYTTDDHETWGFLFRRQTENLKDKCYDNYLSCLQKIEPVLHDKNIPDFKDLALCLETYTGWTIKVVPGIIPVDEFLDLLSKKIFCSSTWIRDKKHLDYLKEPDMFHDIYGHIPILVDERFSDFTQKLGLLGVQYKDKPDLLKQLEAFYWFTIEFGVMQAEDSLLVYGAGLISSYGETLQVVNNEAIVYPFDVEKILNHSFDNSVMQPCYYAIESIEQLYNSMPQLEKIFEQQSEIKV